MPLDGFNRALAVVVAAVIAASGGLGALVTSDIIGSSTIAPPGFVREQLEELARTNGGREVAATADLGTLAAAGMALLAAELRPVLRRPYVRTGNGTDREFAVRERAVEQMVRYASELVEEVVAVEEARVAKDERGLEVACKVTLQPYAAAGPLAPILEARIRNAVYTMTGLSVGRVRLRLQHQEDGRVV